MSESSLLPTSAWELHPDNPATETSTLRTRPGTRSSCPLCTSTKRCKVTDRGAILCRTYDYPLPMAGWKFVRPLAKGMGGLWVPVDAALPQISRPPQTKPIPALFAQPVPLTDQTLNEWTASAVDPSIILSNVREHPQGGWLVCGVDLETGLRQHWYQWKPQYRGFHPDRPKYLSPKGVPVEPLLLEVPSPLWEKCAQIYNLPITPTDQILGFWHWVSTHPEVPIFITEGGKKAGSLLTAGYIALSIPGVSTCRKYGILHPWLTALAQGRTVYLLFDNDILTKPQVRAALSRLSGLLRRAGAEVRIIELPAGPHKGADDYLVAHGPSALAQLVTEARTYHQWLVAEDDLPADIPITECSDPWMTGHLPAYGDLPPVLFVRSPVGTGKTQALIPLVQAAPCVLVITHRQSLAWQLARRLGITCYLSGAYSSDKLVVCADSLVNLNPSSYDLVILDESEQVLRHLCGITVRPRLDEVLQTFLAVTTQAQHLICLDAHLGRLTVQTVNRPDGQLLINHHQPGGRRFLRHPSRQHLQARLFQCLAQGERVAYAANSRKEIQNLEEALSRHFPQKKIISIHSQNLSPENQNFLDHINDQLVGIDCLLYSPTIGTGVSIDVEHFDRVFLCGVAGTTAPTDLIQQQGRVRQPRSGEVEFWVDPRYINRPQDKSFYGAAYDLAEQWTAQGDPLPEPSNRQRWFTRLWSAVRAQESRGLVHLGELFEYYVQADGHTLQDATPLSPDSLVVAGERLRLSAQEIQTRRICGIATARDLTPSQYRQLKELLEASGYLPLERHWELERYELRSFYGQAVTPELVADDRRGRLRREISALEIYLAPDEALQERDRAEREHYREHRHYYLLQKHLLQRLFKAAHLEDLTPGQEFTRSDLREFTRLCKKYARSIYAAFHLTVPTSIDLNPVQFLGTLLRRIGYRLCSRQKRIPVLSQPPPVQDSDVNSSKKIDNRQRIYWLDPAAVKQMTRWIEHRQSVEEQVQLTSRLTTSMADAYNVLCIDLSAFLGDELGPLRATAERWLERLCEDDLPYALHEWLRQR
ncbi:plasmid replication protein, CyRepA1 family [Anthocerotibacter panamensis]|uniref:plasmid replication protein, CyRepA1 family n=1 Tax=Anthocerotibacter panamensis TaxID=2857077 RepID=UPI001C403747|nr:plasmid replication protein, CyRepA1 family [Anthocerotibacter panamensis]